MAKYKKHIPLFQILKELKPYQRQIILDHLDNDSCESLSYCIATVLKSKNKKISDQNKKELGSCIKDNKSLIIRILKEGKGSSHRQHLSKKRALAKIGGNPLGLILTTAIPILMELLNRNRK